MIDYTNDRSLTSKVTRLYPDVKLVSDGDKAVRYKWKKRGSASRGLGYS